MKKFCIILCCTLMMQMLFACNNRSENIKQPTIFYYNTKEVTYNSPNGIIQPEIREGAELHGNLTAYLHSYLRGPVSHDLQRIIPSDVYLVSCTSEDDLIEIVFSKQFSNLSGIDLICACSALLLSVHDFTGIETISISAKDALLEDKEEFIFTMDDIVWVDTATIQE